MSSAAFVREKLNKLYGADVAYLMSDVANAAETAVATGIPAVDYGLFGIGGIPRGHFIELAGQDKSGKTTLVLHMIASCQRDGIVPVVIDPKGAVTTDTARAQRIGVSLPDCVLLPIETSEEALQRTRDAIKRLQSEGVPLGFFWDDMGITPSDPELHPRKDPKTKQDVVKVGAKASAMWRFCRTLAGTCYRHKAVMVVVNQFTAIINSGFVPRGAPTETTMGGGGLRYTARIRIMLRKGSRIKKGVVPIGRYVYAHTEANAFFKPHLNVSLMLNFQHGYDARLSTLYTAEHQGILKKVKKRYRVVGRRDIPHFLPGDVNDETLAEIETRLWPWLTGNYDFDRGADTDDGGDDEAEEDDFADLY